MKPSLAKGCPINVQALIESKLLAQANSGGGKSWAIRRLAEQTYGKLQHIIIDHDGEYHTLAEKFDYVLARKGGDVPVDIKSAALLARRLLELGVSAIVDIYELGTQRQEFVKRFLEALVNSPRELWHPCLVVVDEAHFYCPEVGSSVSANAVKQLMSLGRKRGFCGVLATQRIAKLSKDAAAECNNKLIGRSALDVDMKRAADELGFTTKEDRLSLRTLQAGQFYVFGPAFSETVTLIKVGDVQTTHLRAGQRTMPPPAPRATVKKVLAQLADLPREADQESKSVAELQAQVKQLRGELKRAQSEQPKAETKIIEKPAFKDGDLKRLENLAEKLREGAGHFRESSEAFYRALQTAVAGAKTPPPIKLIPIEPNGTRPPKQTLKIVNEGDGALPVGEQAVLRALIQFPAGLRREQLTVLTGYARSTRDLYISRLATRGLITTDRWNVFATDEGRAAMPDAAPLPTGEALRDFWQHKLPEGEANILKCLIEAYPACIEREVIDEATRYARSTRDLYLSRLAAKQLVVDAGRGLVQASATLFD